MFDNRLRLLREERGLTQKQVAEALKINPRTYASYENNEREPNSEILISISNLFDISVDYLLGLDDARVFKHEVVQKVPEQLSTAEMDLINAYRTLSCQGKEFLQTMLKLCQAYFPNKSHSISRDEVIKNRIENIDKMIERAATKIQT